MASKRFILSIVSLILISVCASKLPAQTLTPGFKNETVSGRMRITTVKNSSGTQITAIYIGDEPDSYLLLPHTYYKQLAVMEGKFVIASGRTVSSVGMQNTLKIKSTEAVRLKKTVTLTGTIVQGKVRHETKIFLRKGKLLYTPMREIDAETMAPFVNRQVTITAYLYGISPYSRKLEEIVKLELAGNDTGTFQYPLRSYRSRVIPASAFGTIFEKAPVAMFNCGDILPVPPNSRISAAGDGRIVYIGDISGFDAPAETAAQGPNTLIIIEHSYIGSEGKPAFICSLYANLNSRIKVKLGDQVKAGQYLGAIAVPRNKKGSRLYFAFHKGPYYQLAPSQELKIREFSRKHGWPDEDGTTVIGEVEAIKHTGKDQVEIILVNNPKPFYLSLLEAVDAPLKGESPPLIMGWFKLKTDKTGLSEWADPKEVIGE